MHFSRALRFVYIGLPRTGSKSMFQWLSENFHTEDDGDHHNDVVPEEFKDYLIFTVVRNPYERMMSGWFFEPVIKYPNDPPRPKTFAELMQRRIKSNAEGTGGLPQKRYVENAGATLALYFERLPHCLGELPFVDKDNIPPLPHNNRGGFRPPEGKFFDHFTSEDEELVWRNEHEDFEAFGYRRFDSGLPEGLGNCIRIDR